MDQINKYIDNPLFLKWVYEQDNEIDAWWDNYLDKNPDEKRLVTTLKNELTLFQIKKHDFSEEQRTKLAHRITARIQVERHNRTAPRFIVSMLKYAAVFIIAVVVSSLFFYLSQHEPYDNLKEERYTTAIAENGQIAKLILPDSSVVWLNSGTQIKYPVDFSIKKREIFLEGQAFFQVNENKEMPFRVFSRDIEIRVLGTCFNVNAYPEKKDVDVVLATGKIELLKPSDGQFGYSLSPGQKIIYDSGADRVTISDVELDRYVKWKEGIIIFREDPMSTVVPVLQRKYDIDLQLDIPEVDNYLFTATITDETLDEILKSIAFTCSAKIKTVKDGDKRTKVILTKK